MKKLFFISFLVLSVSLTSQNSTAINLHEIEIPKKFHTHPNNEFKFSLKNKSFVTDDKLHLVYSLEHKNPFETQINITLINTFYIIISNESNNTLKVVIRKLGRSGSLFCDFKTLFLELHGKDLGHIIIWHILNDLVCTLLIEKIIETPNIQTCILCQKNIIDTCIRSLQKKSFYNFCYLICGHWMHYSCFNDLCIKFSRTGCTPKCPHCSTPIPTTQQFIQNYSAVTSAESDTFIKIF